MFSELKILGGYDKNGLPEAISEISIRKGQIHSIVGFTGSGKSQLISDVEQMAQRDTLSKRQVLLDGEVPDLSWRQNPENKLVAHLSQNMNFVMDMQVEDFLRLHASCRRVENLEKKVREVMACANIFSGEEIKAADLLTRLSGGQSRALMIADVAVISKSPITLIDELENAGIDRRAAMQLLADSGKIVLIVTHDPLLALMGEYRIVMKNGGMQKILKISKEEKQIRDLLEKANDTIFSIQDIVRKGENVDFSVIEKPVFLQKEEIHAEHTA